MPLNSTVSHSRFNDAMLVTCAVMIVAMGQVLGADGQTNDTTTNSAGSNDSKIARFAAESLLFFIIISVATIYIGYKCASCRNDNTMDRCCDDIMDCYIGIRRNGSETIRNSETVRGEPLSTSVPLLSTVDLNDDSNSVFNSVPLKRRYSDSDLKSVLSLLPLYEHYSDSDLGFANSKLSHFARHKLYRKCHNDFFESIDSTNQSRAEIGHSLNFESYEHPSVHISLSGIEGSDIAAEEEGPSTKCVVSIDIESSRGEDLRRANRLLFSN